MPMTNLIIESAVNFNFEKFFLHASNEIYLDRNLIMGINTKNSFSMNSLHKRHKL